MKGMKLLERAFEAEINGALNKGCDLLQTNNNKLADELVSDGYLAHGEYILQGRFEVTVKGYRLTHLGRLTYCSTCEGEDDNRPAARHASRDTQARRKVHQPAYGSGAG